MLFLGQDVFQMLDYGACWCKFAVTLWLWRSKWLTWAAVLIGTVWVSCLHVLLMICKLHQIFTFS